VLRWSFELADDPRLRPDADPQWLKELEQIRTADPGQRVAPVSVDVRHAADAAVRMFRAGVPLLAGTDGTGGAGHPTTHGISYHGELTQLAQAGLTPAQALSLGSMTSACRECTASPWRRRTTSPRAHIDHPPAPAGRTGGRRLDRHPVRLCGEPRVRHPRGRSSLRPSSVFDTVADPLPRARRPRRPPRPCCRTTTAATTSIPRMPEP
jgi:hypothetical protein